MDQYEKKLINWLRSEFKNRNEIQKLKYTLYKGLLKYHKNILDIALPSKSFRNSLEDCIKDARKYNSVSEWSRGKNTKYSSARTHGWIEKCCEHMNKRFVWKKEDVKKIAQRYKSKIEWKKFNTNSYNAAKKHKWIQECSMHMTRPIKKEN